MMDGVPARAGIRRRIEVRGVVQGVGFRPFVYRIARRCDIRGTVLNSSDGVVIEAEGSESGLGSFVAALQTELPPLARIDELSVQEEEYRGEAGFVIEPSAAIEGHFALVPPDIATCAECAADFTSPDNRRFQYPFTNCTNCGPRYTIIRDIPYDRPNTTMADFPMCAPCRAEYEDPLNRRFHAEPNACPDCGPSLALLAAEELAEENAPRFAAGREVPAILQRTRELLRQGRIVAIKGLGGFHLVCDAANEEAVALLRERKRRSGKAFAVMARSARVAAKFCQLSGEEQRLLEGPRKPIVLLARRMGAGIASGVASGVAPGNARLGVMLPYTPLHHLLFDDDLQVLVMTSGNMSEEPIVSRNEDAWRRLHTLADYFLLHNRAIQARVDDSVVQIFRGGEYPVRRSRGYAPDPIRLGMPLAEVLACGGELKNTLCLTKDRYAILSQHIGDLENLETAEFFRETLLHLQRFFRVTPRAVAHDLHPNYLSTRFALRESGLQPIGVQHHHAHIASCMADNGIDGEVIGVALDGTGYGRDGKIWGGEFLTCDFQSFERRGHLRYIPLAGGDRAVRQPWRSALAYLRDTFGEAAGSLPLSLFREVPSKQVRVVESMIARSIQTIETSSCGRLFDAVSSILGIRHETTYEGQAAIELEAAAASLHLAPSSAYPFMFEDVMFENSHTFQVDLRATIESIVGDIADGVPAPEISARFHSTVAGVVGDSCDRIRRARGLNRVCLSGGTFQNLRLLDESLTILTEKGFEVFIHHRVPANDGGLALGQAAIASARLQASRGVS
ncbi:MAG TPA: carbamoyltransferase HypF [Bryobacteraceae bacterium]|jgi:hydrogenase maturation protein HypF|nr:carbamoyltransferase HypF [Bryobacteraceae bacterium]